MVSLERPGICWTNQPRNGSRSAVDVESDPAGASASGDTAVAATKASRAMSQRVFMKAGRDPAAAGSGHAGQPGWCAQCARRRDPSGEPHSWADHGVCRRERGAVARVWRKRSTRRSMLPGVFGPADQGGRQPAQGFLPSIPNKQPRWMPGLKRRLATGMACLPS